ncbi:hypothetical protein [Xanthomonas hortorum]|uniref:hypothetical protein n=1 Tax=Xanthomonas hortorum TaxID=56454 RepID=UPI0029359299|nr:hypothetical protein [Xanthomonas hortorum]MDV2450661.1 hypothetical protein [Xanthomonas hortorum NBC5720]
MKSNEIESDRDATADEGASSSSRQTANEATGETTSTCAGQERGGGTTLTINFESLFNSKFTHNFPP